MFIPLQDDNPLVSIRFQFVTVTLILINVAVFVLFQSGLVFDMGTGGMAALAIIPCQLFGDSCLAAGPHVALLGDIPEWLTPVTYMFLHGSWMHLIGNMLFLWVFGDNVEDAMGPLMFLAFYLLCGVSAGYAHSYMMAGSASPLIGASGAVAGVIAAYLMLHPNVTVWVLALGVISLHLRAVWVLGSWVAMQVFNILAAHGGNTAWWAHIGGLATGALLVLVMRRRGVKLFQ